MEIWIEGVQIKIPKSGRFQSIMISDLDSENTTRRALDLVDRLFKPLLREGGRSSAIKQR